jgi:hypothetical protein
MSVWSVRVLKWILMILALPWLSAHAQASRTWRGLIVPHPESLSGVWEAREGSSFIGLQIHLMTQVKGRPLTLRGVEQTFLSADIEVYERDTSERKPRDGNWYKDNSAGVEWSGWHLTIRPSNAMRQPVVEIDLTLNPKSETWTGRFRRGLIDRNLVLARPSRSRKDVLSPFVGTWRRSTLMNNCLHIAQAEDGALVAWSDDLVTPGTMQYANGLHPPNETLDEFGSFAQLTTPSARSVVIELKALSAICCSVFAGGVLTDDAGSIQSRSDALAWTRVRGNSCIEGRP